jgi:hypothetical protein
VGAYDYLAVPWPLDAPDPQPLMRQELEEAGFRLLGGCMLTADGLRDVGTIARGYGREHGAEFAAWARQPGQVFASPDGTAFAQLAWLWSCRYCVFTTVLADGTLVQTCTEWDADPRWPATLARFYTRTTDRHTEQLVLATDRRAAVVTGDALAAWSAHRERLAATAAPIPEHSALQDFVDFYVAESRARATWARRIHVVSFLAAFVPLLAPFFLVSAVLGDQPWWIDLAILLASALVFLALHQQLWLRVRTWRFLRPRFRAPVPGARGAARLDGPGGL